MYFLYFCDMRIPSQPHIHLVTFCDTVAIDEYVRSFLKNHRDADGFVSFSDTSLTEIIHVGSGNRMVMRTNAGSDNIKLGEMNMDQGAFDQSEILFKEDLKQSVSDFIIHPIGFLEVLGFGYANLIPHLISGNNTLQRITFTCEETISKDFINRFNLIPDYISKL